MICLGPQLIEVFLSDCAGSSIRTEGYFGGIETKLIDGVYNRVSATYRVTGLVQVQDGQSVLIDGISYQVASSKQVKSMCRTVVSLLRAELNCGTDHYLYKLRRDPGCQGCPTPELIVQETAKGLFGKSDEQLNQQIIDKESTWSFFGNWTPDQIEGETWISLGPTTGDLSKDRILTTYKVLGLRDFGMVGSMPFIVATKNQWVI